MLGDTAKFVDDRPRATTEEIRSMVRGFNGLNGSNTGARLQSAGLNLFERVASGGPIVTVGAQADLGPAARQAAIAGAVAAAAVPIVLGGLALFLIFGRK